LIIEHAGLTDIGRVRSRNEDSYSTHPELGLFVLADGMGGHVGGDEASHYACVVIEEYVRRRHAVIHGYERNPTPEHRGEVFRLMEEAVRAASERIIAESESNADLNGMATTVVVLLVVAGRAFVSYVGDSRAYLIRDGRASLLTEDHSLFFELIRQGRLTRDTSNFPYKNVVTRALGVRGTALADSFDFDLLPGDRLLLCSDGLHGYLDDEETFLLAGNSGLQEAGSALVDFANQCGGADNITVVLVGIKEVDGDADEIIERERLKALFPILSGVGRSGRIRLTSAFEWMALEDGQTLFDEGGESDGLFCVLSGEVEILRGEEHVAMFGPGSNFGEMSLVEKNPRLATAKVRGSTELLVLDRKTFAMLVRRYPRLANKLLLNLVLALSRRLRGTNDELVILQTYFNSEGLEIPDLVSSEALVEEGE